MSDDPLSGNKIFSEQVDRDRVGIRTDMSTENRQLLLLSDDAPVDGRFTPENTELHEASGFSQHVEALDNALGTPGCLDVDRTPITAGQVPDRPDDVLFLWIEHDIGAEFCGGREA